MPNYNEKNYIYKLQRAITILGAGIILAFLAYQAIALTIYTQIGFWQITIEPDNDNYFYLSDDYTKRKIYCNKIVYNLLCSFEETNPNACYYIVFSYCTIFPDFGILHSIQYDNILTED